METVPGVLPCWIITTIISMHACTTKDDMLLMLLMIGREDPTVGVVMSMSTLGIVINMMVLLAADAYIR